MLRRGRRRHQPAPARSRPLAHRVAGRALGGVDRAGRHRAGDAPARRPQPQGARGRRARSSWASCASRRTPSRSASCRGRRLFVYDIKAAQELQGRVGEHPRLLVLARLEVGRVRDRRARDDSFDAPSDLYRIEIDGGPRVRVTRDRKSLNPLWGAGGIIHDRQRRADGGRAVLQPVRDPARRRQPAADHRAAHPEPGAAAWSRSSCRPTASGCWPSSSARTPASGSRSTRRPARCARSARDSENGFVAANLIGGRHDRARPHRRPRPGPVEHNVVTMPYRGGKATVLVRHASFPDWSR